MKAEYFSLAKDVAAIYDLLREGMHIKGIDMGLISTQAWANISVGHLVWTICSAPKDVFFPNRSFTSKGSSGDQRDGTQKTPNPEAGQLRRTPGARGCSFFFRKNFKIRENGHFWIEKWSI